MTRTTGTGPKHGSGRRTAEGRQAASAARRIEAVGLLVGLLAGFGVALLLLASRSSAPPPAPPTVSTDPPVAVPGAVSDAPAPAALDKEWLDYSDRSTCADWAGGDGVSAFRLNSSQLAWFFSDTYLGPAGPDVGFSHISGFVHNSVVVQSTTGSTSTFVTMTGGGACPGPGQLPGPVTSSVVGPPSAPGALSDRYWDADGIEIGGVVDKFYNRFLAGQVPYIATGTVIASFPVSQLSSIGSGSAYGEVARPTLTVLPSYTPPAGGSPIVWGAALLQVGTTVYVYGTQTPNPSAPARELYLARVPASQLTQFSAWQFYVGDGQWAAQQQDAQPAQSASSGLDVSSGFSVIQAGQTYWLIQADPIVGSQDIDAYPAATPWGPFDPSAEMVLYRNSDVGADPAHDYRIMYEARVEPALSTSQELVISYNVNSIGVTTGCVPLADFTNTVTQPRFIAVPMAAFTEASGDAAGLGNPAVKATAGPPDYPSIVSRNPRQWFDGWDYSSGCPPVPAVTSVRAQPRSGTVALSWPDAGLDIHYQVSLLKPGSASFSPATTANSDGATISGLSAGVYLAQVVPANTRQTTGQGAEVSFTIP